jgi:hypothetical protein
MRQSIPSYIPYMQEFVTYPNKEVSKFAKDLIANTNKLLSNNISIDQFKIGNNLKITEDMSDQEKLARSSLNYMKSRVIEFY